MSEIDDVAAAAPTPTPEVPTPPDVPNLSLGDCLGILQGAVALFVTLTKKTREDSTATALKAAGGDIYGINKFGFDPTKFHIIEKAEDFLKALNALK